MLAAVFLFTSSESHQRRKESGSLYALHLLSNMRTARPDGSRAVRFCTHALLLSAAKHMLECTDLAQCFVQNNRNRVRQV